MANNERRSPVSGRAAGVGGASWRGEEEPWTETWQAECRSMTVGRTGVGGRAAGGDVAFRRAMVKPNFDLLPQETQQAGVPKKRRVEPVLAVGVRRSVCGTPVKEGATPVHI
ncbi:hypothetical protein NDU88_002313 [Pleurodeles waltl]|uniref:Uncharacterized protein n=1 Tax=Pleurodeles waltl TaxID=8319 RepID=A0AAV7NF33_PLEWA|nr:hypothetical protein NDU88_002313 [Pleurodeles waltl]